MLVTRPSPSLLGAPTSTFSVSFNVDDFSEALAAGLGINLPDAMQRAVRKRKAEYVAGRFCARQAMAAVAANSNVEVVTLPDRRPSWPPGVVGSITHTSGFASASICRTEHARGVGIDAEQIMSEATVRSVRDAVITRHDTCPEDLVDEAVWATLVFSAKESVFKCIYPLVKKFFRFEAVGMQILDTASQSFRATFLTDLSDEWCRGATIDGRYQVDPPYVHTGVILPA